MNLDSKRLILAARWYRHGSDSEIVHRTNPEALGDTWRGIEDEPDAHVSAAASHATRLLAREPDYVQFLAPEQQAWELLRDAFV